jgi:ribokinase
MIVVIGSLNVDLVVHIDRFPNPGETLLGSDTARHRGGKGGNQAVAAARAGATVKMVGRLGDDPFGEWLRAGLAAEGIDHRAVLNRAGAATGMAFISVDRSGQNTIIVSPGANSRLNADELEAEGFVGASLLLLQLEIPLAAALTAARLARAAGTRVVLNLAPATTLHREQLQDIDVLVVNESEAALLLNGTVEEVAGDPQRAAEALSELVPTSILTLGAAGVAWAERDRQGSVQHGRVAGHAVTPVDTTAAGDAFVGALAAALDHGEPLARAIERANAAGALAVTHAGAQPSLPYAEAIARLVDEGTP